MPPVTKAMIAFLTALVGLYAALGFHGAEWVTPDLVSSVGSILGALLSAGVAVIPHK